MRDWVKILNNTLSCIIFFSCIIFYLILKTFMKEAIYFKAKETKML